jgi:hypothetical protein
MLLIGSRHRRDSCSEAYRFARSGASQPTRRSTSTSRTPLMGFIDRPSADTTVAASTPVWAVAQASVRDCHIPNVFRSCRSSRLQRFPPQRADPKTRPFDSLRVCCTPQPAMGFTTFRTPWLGLSAGPRPEGRGPHGPGGVFPSGEYPSKRSPPRQPSTMPSPRLVLSDSAAYTGWRALSPFRAVLASVSPRCAALLADLRAFFRRGVRCGRATFPLRARSMLPWALDRLVPDAATRFAPPSLVLDVSPCGPTASASPTRMSREGKMSRPCLAPCDRWRGLPRREDRGRSRWLQHLPKEAPRPHPYWAPKESVGCRWIRPEEAPPRRSWRPKARGCRRDRDASPKRLVRDPALAPKSGAGGSSFFSPSFSGRPRT